MLKLAFVSTVTLISCGVAQAQTYGGDWEWGNAPLSRTFSLHLVQDGNQLHGQYCAVAQNGNRTDCDDETNENIKGTIRDKGRTARIEFASFFGATEGVALLKRSGSNLNWSITKNPVGGEFFAPSKATLIRKN